MASRLSALDKEAWRIHRKHGEPHPPEYEGPCWGPTAEEYEQARRNLAETTEEDGRG